MPKIISHRGNLLGPDPTRENCPKATEECLNIGIDVELDLRYFPQNNSWYLGHDAPDYLITLDWLSEKSNRLWIHCKNIEALFELNSLENSSQYNYFWHETDKFTLTSQNYIWTFPGNAATQDSIIVDLENKTFSDSVKYYGICTDMPLQLLA
jgi:hypothetical protein